MKVLIVEDETTAAESLAYMLGKIDTAIEIVGFSESVEQTVEILCGNQGIDLIFMDIHLSDGSAFAVFDKADVKTPIVFTTAYDQYALDAFKVNSIDYLLKPIKPAELRRAIEKYRQRTPGELMSYLASMSALHESNRYPTRIIIPVRDKLLPISVNDICYIYSTNRHTEIALKDTRKIALNKTLEQIEASLNPQHFIRANKQFIIAKDAIKELVTWFDSRLLVRMITETPEELYISKNNVAPFKKWLVQ